MATTAGFGGSSSTGTGAGGGQMGMTTGTVGTTGIQCQPGFQLCAGVCVDVLTASDNCGVCGNACPEGRMCAGGTCSSECVDPYTDCGGVCVRLASDASNCGACGTVCELGTPCVGGVCGCPDGTLLCQGQCADPLSNAQHCGSCDSPCPAGGVCVNGSCECPAGRTLCGNECVSLATAEHCGNCDTACGAGQICALGQCIADTQPCPGQTIRCGSGCVDILSDPGHCGACDMGCDFSEACNGGTCGCPAGFSDCESGCLDTSQNPLNCGACGNTCTSGQTCQGGTCRCTDANATLCGNACANLQNSPQHCGSCNNACQGGLPCTDGECRCPEGQEFCNGQCVSVESDPAHCGACGMACPEGESCIVGTCSGSVGDSCTSQPAHGISITELAVYQSGKISVMQEGNAIGAGERDVDVVAGKNGIVRVFVQLEQGFTNRVLSARLTLIDGEEVEQVFHKKTVDTSSMENSLATTFNIEVEGDLIKPTTRYSVEIVECDAASTGTVLTPRFPATGEEALEARELGILRIEFIPITANGNPAQTDAERLDLYRDYMELMYPVSAVEYTVGEPMQANSSISANGGGWEQVLQQLGQRHQSDDAPNDLYYYGLLEPAASLNQYCQGGCVAGIGYVPGTNTRNAHQRVSTGISYANIGSATTMAHEIGHNHGRPHAPCGGASGAESFPHDGATIGWWGFIFPDTLIAGNDATDIMGYCRDQWVSDYNYVNFMERVAAINGALSVVNPNPYGYWEVIVTSTFGQTWGVPPVGYVTAVGEPEPAKVLDRLGNEVAQVTVYRSVMDHLNGASIMVPTPEPGWHAIQVQGALPMVYGTGNSSVP